MISMSQNKIAIIGLGYVGLPLATEFGKIIETVGLDLNRERIEELLSGYDSTLEVESSEIRKAKKLSFTSNLKDIRDCNYFIVTVPTPIDKNKDPDLEPLITASVSIGSILKSGDIVIYESTVFPGATEEICVPILEKHSKLKFNVDFFCGYSPERINPGDREHRLTSIMKVTSGSTPEIAKKVDTLYKKIIKAGTYKADSIKIAEAAKVIENTQRDINIALINELSMIFNKMGIDTKAVLEAAETKWNFLPFKPGLVGGHCIGIDPYYLTYKAKLVGYNPEMILAGRRLNDGMPKYICSEIFRLFVNKDIKINNSSILIMGLTFKENCPDLRNSKVLDIIGELDKNGCKVCVYDPWVKNESMFNDTSTKLIDEPKKNSYDAIILAVNHDVFKNISLSVIKSYGKKNHIIYDVKHIFDANDVDGRL